MEFFFFSSKNSSPAKRRKCFKISLYKILCNNNTGVVRTASKISNKYIFIILFFRNYSHGDTHKGRTFKLFFFFFPPQLFNNCFNSKLGKYYFHTRLLYNQEVGEARMRQLIFIEREMEKKFARKLFFPFQFQFQFYFSIIKPPFRPINFTKKQHLARQREQFPPYFHPIIILPFFLSIQPYFP